MKARLVDDTGSVTATFFNQSYMKDALRTGETYVVYGRVEGPPGRRQMTNPVCERRTGPASPAVSCPSIP